MTKEMIENNKGSKLISKEISKAKSGIIDEVGQIINEKSENYTNNKIILTFKI